MSTHAADYHSSPSLFWNTSNHNNTARVAIIIPRKLNELKNKMAAKKYFFKFRPFKCGVILFHFINSCANVFYRAKGCCICQKRIKKERTFFPEEKCFEHWWLNNAVITRFIVAEQSCSTTMLFTIVSTMLFSIAIDEARTVVHDCWSRRKQYWKNKLVHYCYHCYSISLTIYNSITNRNI